MLTCPKCGVDSPNDAFRHCPNCGARLARKTVESSKHSPSTWVIVSAFAVIGCISFVLLGALIVSNIMPQGLSSASSSPNRRATTSANANSVAIPTERSPESNPTESTVAEERRRQTATIFTSSVGINAGHVWRIPFEVDNAQGGHLVGSFTADGGGNNDIECFVISESEYQNFKNDNQYRVFYESGRVTTADVDIRLRPGRYFLIFSNRWALLAAKTVEGNIVLEQ